MTLLSQTTLLIRQLSRVVSCEKINKAHSSTQIESSIICTSYYFSSFSNINTINEIIILYIHYLFITVKNYHTKKSLDQNYAKNTTWIIRIMIWVTLSTVLDFFLIMADEPLTNLQFDKRRPRFFPRIADTIISTNTERENRSIYIHEKNMCDSTL